MNCAGHSFFTIRTDPTKVNNLFIFTSLFQITFLIGHLFHTHTSRARYCDRGQENRDHAKNQSDSMRSWKKNRRQQFEKVNEQQLLFQSAG